MKPLLMSICLLFLAHCEVLMADDFSGQYHGTSDFCSVVLQLNKNDLAQYGIQAQAGSGGLWIANPYGGTGTTVTY